MPNNFDYSLAVTKFNANEIRQLALDKEELERDLERLEAQATEIAAKINGLEIIQATYRLGYGIGDIVKRKDGQEFLVTRYGGWSFDGKKKLKDGSWAKHETYIHDATRIKERVKPSL